MKTRNLFIFLAFTLLILVSIADAQRTSRIFRPCRVTPANPAKVEVASPDRIEIRTCTPGAGETNIDSNTVRIGDINQMTAGTRILLDDLAGTIDLIAAGTSVGELTAAGINVNGFISFTNPMSNHIVLARTVTPAGTTGNRTIHAMAGTVNFAAGTSSITVTNLTASATSLIFCTVQTNDATANACRVTDKGAGAFTIRLNANATAETSVAFWVTN